MRSQWQASIAACSAVTPSVFAMVIEPGAQGRSAVCMALLRNWAASNCWAVTPGPGRVAGRDSQGAVVSYNGH